VRAILIFTSAAVLFSSAEITLSQVYAPDSIFLPHPFMRDTSISYGPPTISYGPSADGSATAPKAAATTSTKMERRGGKKPDAVGQFDSDDSGVDRRETGWEFVGSFRLCRETDFSIGRASSTSRKDAESPTIAFVVKLCADESVLMLMEGELLTFVAECRLEFPPEYHDHLKRAGCPFIHKPIRVRMQSTLDSEGSAKFRRAEFFPKVANRLRKDRILDSEALRGLEELEIGVSGVARLHDRLFKSSNTLKLTAKIK